MAKRKSLFAKLASIFSSKETDGLVNKTPVRENVIAVKTSYGTFTAAEMDIIDTAFRLSRNGEYDNVTKMINDYPKLFVPMNTHFIYNNLQETLYKKREDPKFLELVKNVCIKDFELIKKDDFKEMRKYGASFPCLERLVIIYERANELEKALEILQYAVDNGFRGSYDKKLAKVQAKLGVKSISESTSYIDEVNEDGISVRELQVLSLVQNRLDERNIKDELSFFIDKDGDIQLSISYVKVARFKIRNASEEYYNSIITKIDDWIDVYVAHVENINHLLKKNKKQ